MKCQTLKKKNLRKNNVCFNLKPIKKRKFQDFLEKQYSSFHFVFLDAQRLKTTKQKKKAL